MSHEAFDSSNRSITRARKHIDDLEAGIAQFNNAGDVYEIIKEEYENGNKYVIKARLINNIPADLESIAVDAIYNLRSSLDQAVFSLAEKLKERRGTGIDLSKRHWKFPIAKTKDKVSRDIDSIIKPDGIPDEVKDIILNFSPYYNASNEQSLLYALNKLANINKHRYMSSSEIRSNRFHLRYVSGPKTINPPSLNEFTLGGEGHTVTSVWPNAPVGQNEIGFYCGLSATPSVYDVSATISIKFADVEGLLGRGCVFQLNAIADICDAVIEAFSTFLNY